MLANGLRIAIVCVGLLFAGAPRAQDAVAGAGAHAIAIAQAPQDTGLADILSGRAKVGFDPIDGDRITIIAPADDVLWLRVRADVPDDGQARVLRLERQAIDHARLFVASAPAAAVAETGLDVATPRGQPEPDGLLLPLPAGAHGLVTVYVQLTGRGFLYLHPQVLTSEDAASRSGASASLDRWVQLLLALVAILGLVRRIRQPDSGTLSLTVAALAVAVACLATNGQLVHVPGAASIARFGPSLVPGLWLLACAPLLWCTRRYAGLDKHSPLLADLMFWGALVFVALAVASMVAPPGWLGALQVAALVGLALAGLTCIAALLADPRQARMPAVLIWVGLLAAVLAQALIYAQVLPATLFARRGFQVMLALLLAVYLVLPWLREIVRERAKLKRAVVPELTAEEKIAQAREQMMASLQTGLMNASEGDMEWIAYRRLLEGLKPVLAQVASAVVAMNYHHEDLLLVEPRDAEPRYRMLLQQRSQLLKNLSRSRAPQQVSIDFDGPDGPLSRVQLAVIPLPIDRPGWGALLVERDATVEYSELELDLCAEFASLATTAGDEAAEAMEARRASDFDPESGVYKRELIDRALRQAHEAAFLQRTALSVLRVGHDSPGRSMAPLADLVRDEIDYGETVGRFGPDELLVLLPERTGPMARELAERVLAGARKQGLAASVGVSMLHAGERAPTALLERASQALAKARSAGGGQVQVVSAT
jgi:GGDEF domain-containing protein